MTDQHQPAAVAPGLSEDEILAEAESWKRWKSPETWGNTESGAHAWGWQAGHEHAKAELDLVRADLARARAEAEALRPSGEQDECPLPERLDPELGKIVRDRVACGQFLDPERAGSLLDAAVKTRRDLSDTWTRLCHVAQDRDGMLVTDRNLRRALAEAQADLTRTRAEAAALKAALDRIDDLVNSLYSETSNGIPVLPHDLARLAGSVLYDVRLALAASQAEEPAAPVAPRGVACPQCGGEAFASFDVIVGRGCGHVVAATTPAAPVARSAEAAQSKVPTGFIEVRPGLYERRRPAPNWDQPPDHQAGDESDGTV